MMTTTLSRTILKRFLFLFLLLSLLPKIKAQESEVLISDSASIERLLDQAYTLEIENPDSALAIYALIVKNSSAIPYELAHARAHLYSGIVHSDQGAYNQAIPFFERAIELFEKEDHLRGIAAANVNLGNIEKRKAQYGEAVDFYVKGAEIFEEIGDTSSLIFTYSNVGSVLTEIELFEKSLEYNRRAEKLSRIIEDSLTLCNSLINVGNIHIATHELDSAKIVFDQVMSIAQNLSDPISSYLAYNNLNSIAVEKGDFETALELSRSALGYAQIMNNPAYTSNAELMLGQVHYKLNNLDSARFYLINGIETAKDFESEENYLIGIENMIVLEESSGNLASALEYSKELKEKREEQSRTRQNKVVAGLEIQYESKRKDLELQAQELEIETKQAQILEQNYLIIALALLVLVLILMFVLVRNRIARKKKQAELEASLSKERIETLKREKEVASLVAMLEGEDRERTRLAKDLHDGLGGMLSATRMRFDQIQQSHAELEKSNEYSQALELIDQTSQEARRISHNLMPGSLEMFGLQAALEDLVKNIEASTELEVSLQVLDLESELTPKISKNIYRIIQELSNNTIKYASASELIIQLSEIENEIHITVEDDGKGFDTKNQSDGLGLRSIKSRVDHLNGQIEISSDLGEGSSFEIVVPIE